VNLSGSRSHARFRKALVGSDILLLGGVALLGAKGCEDISDGRAQV
jgi:hypothetical protein